MNQNRKMQTCPINKTITALDFCKVDISGKLTVRSSRYIVFERKSIPIVACKNKLTLNII